MWFAIAAAVSVAVVAVALGLPARVLELIAGLLVLSCLGVCIAAAIATDRASRRIVRLTEEALAAQRRATP